MADDDSSDDASSEQSEAFEEDNLTRQMEVNEDEVPVLPAGRKPKLTCQNCTREFQSQNSLLRHIKEDLGCQAFPCRRCNVVCGTKMAVNRHYDRKHPEHKEEIDEICPKQDLFVEKRALAAFQDANRVCYICFQPFRSGSSLKQHLDKKHNTQALAACLRCGAVTGHRNIKKHYRSKHPEHLDDLNDIDQKLRDDPGDPSNDKVPSNSLACLRCSFHSRYRNSMRRHYQRNHPENSSDVEQIRHVKEVDKIPQNAEPPLEFLSCLRCSFYTRYRNSIFRHYQRIHPENVIDLEQPELLRDVGPVHVNEEGFLNYLSCSRCSFRTRYRNNMFRHYGRRHPEYRNDLSEINHPVIPGPDKVFDPSIYMSCLRCSHYTKYNNNLHRHYKRLHPEHLEDIKQIPKIPLNKTGDVARKGKQWSKGTADNDWKLRKPQVGKTRGKNSKELEPPTGFRRSDRIKSCKILQGSHSPEAGSCSTCRNHHTEQSCSYMEIESDPELELTDVASARNLDQNPTGFATRQSGRLRKMATPRKLVQNVKRGPGRPRKISNNTSSAALCPNTKTSLTSPQTHIHPGSQGAFFFGIHSYNKTTENENSEQPSSRMETECNPIEDQSDAEQTDVAAPRNMDQNVQTRLGRPRKGNPRLAELNPDAQSTEVVNTQASPEAGNQTCVQGDHIKSITTPQTEATLLDIQTALLAIKNSHKETTAKTAKISHDATNLASDSKSESASTYDANSNQAPPQQVPEESHLTPDEPQNHSPLPVYSPRKMPTRSALMPESILRDNEIPAWGEEVVLSQASGNQEWSNTIADAEPSKSPQIPNDNPPESLPIPNANPPESLQMVMETCDGDSSDNENQNEPGTNETTTEAKCVETAKEGKLTKMTETVTWTTFRSGCKIKERKQADEVEALTAIYGEDWCVLDEANRVYRVTVASQENGNDKSSTRRIDLQISLPIKYPSRAPPDYQINAPWLKNVDRQFVVKKLEHVCRDNAGECVLYLLCEQLREHLDKKTMEDTQLGGENILHDDASALASRLDSACLHQADSHECEIPPIEHGDPITDRRSTFQAHLAAPITTVKQVAQVRRKLLENRKIANATHNILAYRICCENRGRFLQDCDNDGEAAAGPRLLHLLEILDVRNVLVIVSRWYGGIQLGPDRFKHINNAARNILETHGHIQKDEQGMKKKGKHKSK